MGVLEEPLGEKDLIGTDTFFLMEQPAWDCEKYCEIYCVSMECKGIEPSTSTLRR